ncbi:MAG: trypsin-like peptidase domain-containing protein [Armatimonadota bacterium]
MRAEREWAFQDNRQLIVVTFVLIALAIALLFVFPKTSAQEVLSPNGRTAAVYISDSFSDIAEKARLGVVSITAIQRPGATRSGVFSEPETLPDPLIPNLGSDDTVRASGSGSIVRRSGNRFYILTNDHVVTGSYSVSVRLADGTRLTGTVVGTDSYTDLAVVSVVSDRLSDRNVLPMGDSSTVRVGSWALALGSPYGFEETLTVGVVSALHRELQEGETDYPDLIQTDADINKGNSGGPLLNIDGKIIGVNTAIASPTGGSIGLGFAIPINEAKEVLSGLIQDGRIVRGWLGIGIQELTPVLGEYYKVAEGVLVAGVDENGPARAAGLMSEDIITEIDGTPVTGVRQLQRRIADVQPGGTAVIKFTREGVSRTVQAKIGMSPLTSSGPPKPTPGPQDMGVDVRTLTESLAREIGLSNTTGVIVVDVETGSLAEEAGIEEGDIITRVNGRSAGGESEFESLLRKTPRGGAVVLRTVRKGETRIIGLRKEWG